MKEWLPEYLRTLKNHILTCEILINLGRWELLPTQLEEMFELMQKILVDYCVKEVKDAG